MTHQRHAAHVLFSGLWYHLDRVAQARGRVDRAARWQAELDVKHPILHFEHADNFAVAYYAGGDTQPKGLPFTAQPEIEPAPGAWRSQTTVYGDQIRSAGPVATHGSAISTGSGVAFVGNRNVVVTGKVGGDVMVDSTKQSGGGSSEDFYALLAELRKQLDALQSQGLGADVGAEAGAELDQAAELAERDEPPSKRIVRALENVKDILEAAGGTVVATLTLVPLVNQAIQLAQSLFG